MTTGQEETDWQKDRKRNENRTGNGMTTGQETEWQQDRKQKNDKMTGETEWQQDRRNGTKTGQEKEWQQDRKRKNDKMTGETERKQDMSMRTPKTKWTGGDDCPIAVLTSKSIRLFFVWLYMF